MLMDLHNISCDENILLYVYVPTLTNYNSEFEWKKYIPSIVFISVGKLSNWFHF